MKLSTFFYLLALIAMMACKDLQKPKQTLREKQKNLDLGKLDEKNVYTVDEVGWKVILPENWQVFTKRESYALMEKGQKAFQDTYGSKIDASKLIHLLNIKKDIFNSFQSTMQPFDQTKDGDYDQATIVVQEMIKDVYRAKGIPFEEVLGAVKIDGIMFDRLELTVYSLDKKKVILEQKIFNALVNGYDFSMNINFNNPNDEETLMNMVMSSKFFKTH